MFKKKLESIFILMVIVAIGILGNNYYNSYTFKHSDISDSHKQRIQDKESEILTLMNKEYGFAHKFDVVITDKFKGKLYGLTSYNNGKIIIYLNKKVMRESMDYMVKSVIAHEYAHALMFKQGYMESSNDGHSKRWQEICLKIGGDDCQQYVDTQEIVMSKMPFG